MHSYVGGDGRSRPSPPRASLVQRAQLDRRDRDLGGVDIAVIARAGLRAAVQRDRPAGAELNELVDRDPSARQTGHVEVEGGIAEPTEPAEAASDVARVVLSERVVGVEEQRRWRTPGSYRRWQPPATRSTSVIRCCSALTLYARGTHRRTRRSNSRSPSWPGIPCGPWAPVSPFTPGSSGMPWSPLSPLSPSNPGSLGCPGRPSNPGSLGCPGRPSNPGSLGCPGRPCRPSNPGSPASPAARPGSSRSRLRCSCTSHRKRGRAVAATRVDAAVVDALERPWYASLGRRSRRLRRRARAPPRRKRTRFRVKLEPNSIGSPPR